MASHRGLAIMLLLVGGSTNEAMRFTTDVDSSTNRRKKCIPVTTGQRVAASDKDTYMAWLNDPPCEVRDVTASLVKEADELVQEFNGNSPSQRIGDVDLVVSGSAYLDRYYVGVHMILTRARGLVTVKRISGASSGANAPFDLLHLGETPALNKFLTFGLLGENYWYVRWFGVADQSYWFKAIDWMFDHHGGSLSQLNDKMFVWMSCKVNCTKFWCGKQHVNLSRFDDTEKARQAYRATGSVSPSVDVSPEWTSCTDGSVGEIFKDGKHAQITISPTRALGAFPGVLFGYTMKEYADGVRQGMRDAVEFLKTRVSNKQSIIFCEPGSPCKNPII